MTSDYDPRRIRAQLRPFELTRMFRVVRSRFEATPLDARPAPSRFSDPSGGFSVLYASESVVCSFWEALVRSRFDRRRRRELPRADVEDRFVVEFRSTETLWLVDLRGDGPIRIAAPTAVAHDTNHAAGRTLAAATHLGVREADGFVFQSRFTGHLCVALFDRCFPRLEKTQVLPLLRYADVWAAIEDYEITLTLPP